MKAAHRSAKRTRVTKTLWPPQAGTIKLGRQYGDSLLCVRYRHDGSGLKRYTTIELVIDEAPVVGKQVNARLFAVHMLHAEDALIELALKRGAHWHARDRKWIMKGELVKQLGLEEHALPLKRK